MQKITREVQSFFYGQGFADGFRASFAILLPALFGSYLGYLNTGITIALGAMCVSLTDAPGPLKHKVNGMLASAGLIFLTALVTSVARTDLVILSIEIGLLSFFYSMFTVYGNRATAVGNSAILVMILTMDQPAADGPALEQAALICGGGLFYLIISLLSYKIRPYRHAQRALGNCLREIAYYLSIRADFYDIQSDLENNYKKLLAQQVRVNENLDAVRELFFKTRQIVRESTNEGRRLVYAFVESVDLFEDITASYYDYELLRKQFGHTGALELIYSSLKKTVEELHRMGMAIQSNSGFISGFDYDAEIRRLKADVDKALETETSNKLVLRKIVVNIRNLLTGLTNIRQYFEKDIKRKKSNVDHAPFTTRQSLDPKLLFNNFSLKSSVFRHAIRVAAACSVGYVITRLVGYGTHGYWVLLTIAFILRPAFSLTKQRNIERIIGTFAGAVIGVLLLLFIPDKTARLALMIIFMICTYSFMRMNYLVMVIFMTPYVLILFSLLGYGFRDVAEERLIDTLIGCAIAFLASYLLFPQWEAEQLKDHMRHILKANASYLQKILEALSGQGLNVLEYKLVRKEVYLQSANLAAAFQRMLSEPKSKHSAASQVHQFVVLNHILFSNIASLGTSLLGGEARKFPDELVQTGKKAFLQLNEGRKKLGETVEEKPLSISGEHQAILSRDDMLMKEQLSFIYRISSDINRIAKDIND